MTKHHVNRDTTFDDPVIWASCVHCGKETPQTPQYMGDSYIGSQCKRCGKMALDIDQNQNRKGVFAR